MVFILQHTGWVSIRLNEKLILCHHDQTAVKSCIYRAHTCIICTPDLDHNVSKVHMYNTTPSLYVLPRLRRLLFSPTMPSTIDRLHYTEKASKRVMLRDFVFLVSLWYTIWKCTTMLWAGSHCWKVVMGTLFLQSQSCISQNQTWPGENVQYSTLLQVEKFRSNLCILYMRYYGSTELFPPFEGTLH